jgi:hypothetical protein
VRGSEPRAPEEKREGGVDRARAAPPGFINRGAVHELPELHLASEGQRLAVAEKQRLGLVVKQARRRAVELERALEGHTLAVAELIGTYER